jgi:hypothetical protein
LKDYEQLQQIIMIENGQHIAQDEISGGVENHLMVFNRELLQQQSLTLEEELGQS